MLSVATLFLGAFAGALLVLKVAIYWPLLLAVVVAASVGVASRVLGRADPSWR
jgi:hypothetical protein